MDGKLAARLEDPYADDPVIQSMARGEVGADEFAIALDSIIIIIH